MSKYISGRYKKTPQDRLRDDRYRYLTPGDAEPNLGDTPSAQGSPNLPTGEQFVVVGFLDRPGERYWVPKSGGIIPGSLSVFDEGTLTGGFSSTTQLDFKGLGVVAEGTGTNTANPGVAITVTFAPPGFNNSVLFKNNDDFDTDTRFTFDDGLLTVEDRISIGIGGNTIETTSSGSVGIGTTDPTQKLHLDGNFRITGTIYDSNNQPGNTGDLLVKTATGSLLWVTPDSVQAGAGGTIGQVQFHNTAGLVDGAENFYYDFTNNRVGIGSTQPDHLLDVLGSSNFDGGVTLDTLTASQNSTFQSDLSVSKKLTVDQLADLTTVTVGSAITVTGAVDFNDSLDVDGHTDLDNLSVSGVSTFNSELKVSSSGTFKVIGDGIGQDVVLASAGGITTTGGDLYVGNDLVVGGDLNIDSFTAKRATVTEAIETVDIQATGISTFGGVKIDGNYVRTNSGNLFLESNTDVVQVNDRLYVNSIENSTSKDNGALWVEGGAGIEKNLNVGGAVSFTGPSVGVAVTLAAAGGITTTGGDLYVGGDLYINDDIFFDDINGNDMVISGIATVGQLQIGNPDNSLIGITTVLDEDDMVSNSDTALATQQSIKAYVDNEIGNVADTDTTYDLSTNDPGTGNVNLRLTGSDSTIDDVLVSAGTNITLSENGNGTGFTINATSTTFTPTAGYAHTAGISTYTSEWILGANGINDYTFTGPGLTGTEFDPKIYLVRGQQYKFTNNMNAHPFRIQSTANGSTGTQYNDGIVNNDIQNGTLTWNVQFDSPSTLYYQCTAHPNMGGEIVILDAGSGDTNTTYDLETEADGNDIKIKLVGSDSTTGIVTISAGNNITLTDNGDSFTIDAASSSGGSGTLTDVDVKQFSDNSTPRTEYGCSNPIEVTIAAGIATIGIGTTSNAYGKRYYSTTEPTVDVCDGDIWYDPSNGGSGFSGSNSGITDGDYGDITVSNSGQTWRIDDDTVGPDELQDTSVTAGSYTNADITVDAQGRITAAASGAFVGLTDTPSSLTADKWLKVNSSGNALEFVDEPSGSGGSSDPVGTIVAWAGSVANIPSEYQLCDGSAASTSALQAITGSNVPDLTDRFIIGANDVAAESAYPGVGVGSTGGSANSVVASHSHGTYGTESGYRHPVRAGTDATLDWDSHTAHPNDATYDSNSRTDTAGVDSDGNSDSSQTGTNANLPPYYALCYIIKHTATSGSGGSGTLTDVQVKQYSDNSTPRTEYGCSNPIEVEVSAGIATVGIGSTSNAYGKRYIGSVEPTTDVCDGDIWYDTNTSTEGVSGQILKTGTYSTGWGSGAATVVNTTTWTSLAMNGYQQKAHNIIRDSSSTFNGGQTQWLMFDKISDNSHLEITCWIPTYISQANTSSFGSYESGVGIRLLARYDTTSNSNYVVSGLGDGPASTWGAAGYGGNSASILSYSWNTREATTLNVPTADFGSHKGLVEFHFEVRCYNTGVTGYFGHYNVSPGWDKVSKIVVREIAN